MPLPLIIGIGAAIAGTIGTAGAVKGVAETLDAKDRMKRAKSRNESNIYELERKREAVTSAMDSLGKLELKILGSLKKWTEIIDDIEHLPKHVLESTIAHIPPLNIEEVRKVSVGAIAISSGLASMGAGAAAGIAASGATTSAVMALGTASTGTAISTLSGAAATNAALAALGGGSLAAGGGGMALGSLVLGGATLGVGLLVGGVIMGVTGDKLSAKADEAWEEVRNNEKKMQPVREYFDKLGTVTKEFSCSLQKVRFIYNEKFENLKNIYNLHKEQCSRIDYNNFNSTERAVLENTVLLVGVLSSMCKVQLLNKPRYEDDLDIINCEAVRHEIKEADKALQTGNFI